MPEARVAVVYDCLFPVNTGGGERVYRAIAEDLDRRGLEVDYITRAQWADAPPEASFSIVGVSEGPIYDSNGTRTAAGALRFARAVFRYFRLRRGEYDIVLASALPVLTLLAVRLATLGTPTKVVADWLEAWTWRKWRSYSGVAMGTVAFVLQVLGAYATRHHTADSEFTADRIAHIRPGRPPLVFGLVDLVRDDERAIEPAIAPPYAIFVGRLIEDKRVTALPAALAHARLSVPDLRLVVIGDGPQREALVAAVAEEGLEDSVELLGRVDDDTLDRVRGGAAVLVNPSAREGFGLVVAEAAARGIPSVVVEGEDNAAVDLIEPGVNGFVVRDTSPEELGGGVARAVRAGAGLRESSRAWYLDAKIERGLERSVTALLESLGRGSR